MHAAQECCIEAPEGGPAAALAGTTGAASHAGWRWRGCQAPDEATSTRSALAGRHAAASSGWGACQPALQSCHFTIVSFHPAAPLRGTILGLTLDCSRGRQGLCFFRTHRIQLEAWCHQAAMVRPAPLLPSPSARRPLTSPCPRLRSPAGHASSSLWHAERRRTSCMIWSVRHHE